MNDKLKALEAENKALEAENEKLKEQLAALEVDNKSLESKIEKKDTSPIVKGTFTHKKEKYKFNKGRIKTRLNDGSIVPSQVLLEVANGKQPEDLLAKHPEFTALADSDGKCIAGAKAYLGHLVDIGSSYLVKA